MKNPFSQLIIIVLFILTTSSAMAQKQGNIWYFGANAGLDFNTETPTVLTDGMLNTTEGCATISDANGHLLFYTDGMNVYTKHHSTMPNGTGLTGDPSTAQAAVIVPDPGSATRYFVFTVSAYPDSHLSYSVVDMTLNEGMGDVESSKNISVLNNTEESVCAVFANNFYWIITHKRGGNMYYAYKLTDAGLDIEHPVITGIGLSTDMIGDIGYLKSNISGDKLTMTWYMGHKTEVYDFDRSTGILSDVISLAVNASYGVEFSPNSKLLYVHGFGTGTYQFNLEAGSETDIQNSKVTLSAAGSEGALQIAVNGKIYIANYDQHSLSVINNPNVLGTGCNYVNGGQTLGSKTSMIGLPTIISSLVTTGPPVLSAPGAIHITSTGATLEATVNGDGGSEITERGFYYGTSAGPTSNKTIVIGTTGALSADISELTPGTAYYFRAYAVNTNGTTYTVDGTFTTGDGPPPPIVSAAFTINTSNQCITENLFVFTNESENADIELSYTWNFGDDHTSSGKNATHTYAAPGTYTVTLVATPGEGTPVSLTKEVTVYATPTGNVSAAGSTELSAGQSVQLIATSAHGYQWYLNNVAINGATQGVFQATAIGNYTVKLFNELSCGAMAAGNVTVTNTAIVVPPIVVVPLADAGEIFVPKAFTPNGDGKNDMLRPLLSNVRELQHFRVYNRWGNLLFESKDANRGWDGKFKGVLQPMETYIWVATGVSLKGRQVRNTGNTTLVR